jgi:hypothetical protein
MWSGPGADRALFPFLARLGGNAGSTTPSLLPDPHGWIHQTLGGLVIV